ncbi:MAG: hypothetical protein ACTHMI_15230 [Mucilaginibacter sp.]
MPVTERKIVLQPLHYVARDTFFDKTPTYLGAFGSTDWSAGWASYDPQKLPYTTPGAVK